MRPIKTLSIVFASALTLAVAPSAFAQDDVTPPAQVQVHLRKSRPAVVLEAREGDSWVTVCSNTCDRALDVGATYRINGSGVRTSKEFSLDGKPGDHIVLDVDAGSSGGYAAGVVLTTIGAVFLAGGAAFVLGVVAAESSNPSRGDGMGGLMAVVFSMMIGGGATVIGLSTLIPGIVLVVNNGSSVRSNDANPYFRPRDEARNNHDVVPLPRAFGIPIFSATF